MVGFRLTDDSAAVEVAPGPSSKIHTAGFGSLIGTTTNFVGEITYAMPFPLDGDMKVNDPLPFEGEDEIAYVAAREAPETVPLELLRSSAPVKCPVGLAPSP